MLFWDVFRQIKLPRFRNCIKFKFAFIKLSENYRFNQGYNARKVISELYASFVLQWAVMKHKTDVTALHGIHLSHKKSMIVYESIFTGHRKLLYVNY